jgi:hypothetical protein
MIHISELYRRMGSTYVLKTLILCPMLSLFDLKYFLNFVIGFRVRALRACMSNVVSSFVPRSLIF